MKPIAAEIAKQRKLPSSDYRDVIRELKKQQLVGDAILLLYQNRLKQIEEIIRSRTGDAARSPGAHPDCVGRRDRAATRTAHVRTAVPAQHRREGRVCLPLNIPAGEGMRRRRSMTTSRLTRRPDSDRSRSAPGHELQFDSMVEHGVSVARVRYAFNSTNVEGWGLYSEYLVRPFMPLEGQLISLDYRLLRAARAFLDPELQSGKVTPEQAKQVLENDVVQSPAFAEEEVERYTYRAPGQANSYYYGYTKLLALRKDTEAAMGAKFDQKKFHDFILAQGLLPPDLLRKSVMTGFVGAEQAAAAN
jgi:hypothetical protein